MLSTAPTSWKWTDSSGTSWIFASARPMTSNTARACAFARGRQGARVDAAEDLDQPAVDVGDLGGDGHPEVHARDALADRAAHLEPQPGEAQRAQPVLQGTRVDAQVEHRGEEHVAGDASHRLEVEHGAHRPLPVRVALRETSAA